MQTCDDCGAYPADILDGRCHQCATVRLREVEEALTDMLAVFHLQTQDEFGQGVVKRGFAALQRATTAEE